MSVNISHPIAALPTGSARAAQKLATRARLRQAALDCFAAQGYAATQIADIVRAAGVAQGTFYVHFDSKEALLDEALAEFNRVLVERLSRRLAGAPSPALTARVWAAADEVLTAWFEHGVFVRAYAQRAAQGLAEDAFGASINPPALALLSGVLAAETGADAATVDLAAHGLLAMWFRVAMRALLHPEIDRAAARDTLTQMTLGVVRALASDQGVRP